VKKNIKLSKIYMMKRKKNKSLKSKKERTNKERNIKG